MAIILFWFTAFLLIYAWGGYLLVLQTLALCRKRPVNKKDYYPRVTIILTVFNEEKVIRKRLENLLSLDYPSDKLEILVASDGSKDKTNEIVKQYADRGVILSVHEGKGKSITQNAAVKQAKGEIIVFTDAGTLFDPAFLKNIVRNFNDPKVGCVTSEICLLSEGENISEGQSIYWRYENAVRRYESEIGVLAKASGNSLAIRKRLFVPLDGKYGEDCIVPLDTVLQGYRVVFEPSAMVYDDFPSSIGGEFRTRIRMTLRNLTGILSRKQLLNPLKFPLVAFSLISHKILRWFSFFLMVTAFISNLFLLDKLFYQFTFCLQVAFYSLALVGFACEKGRIKTLPLLSAPFSFCLGILGMAIGVLKAFAGKEIVKYKVPIT
ncbi:MAG TPA: glycosyltransferase family 2 protein [Thermodesulfobacteriota bacterium]|nr:glycosyltransferase family 2 protein [Thermodesulfobacteriota bacterium]